MLNRAHKFQFTGGFAMRLVALPYGLMIQKGLTLKVVNNLLR